MDYIISSRYYFVCSTIKFIPVILLAFGISDLFISIQFTSFNIVLSGTKLRGSP
jgi:hypothetical protein